MDLAGMSMFVVVFVIFKTKASADIKFDELSTRIVPVNAGRLSLVKASNDVHINMNNWQTKNGLIDICFGVFGDRYPSNANAVGWIS